MVLFTSSSISFSSLNTGITSESILLFFITYLCATLCNSV
jgi:hypothetical protein